MANLKTSVFGPNTNVSKSFDERVFGDSVIWFYIKAIQAFEQVDGPSLAAAANPAVSTSVAFERFVYPIQKASSYETEYAFDAALISVPCLKQNGTERSPALATFCRRMGLLDTVADAAGNITLSPIAKAIAERKISVLEYIFILLSRQGIFSDGAWKKNFLAALGEYTKQGNWFYERQGFQSYIESNVGVLGDVLVDRLDLLENACRFCGLLQISKNNGVDVLRVPHSAQLILEDIIDKQDIISRTPASTNEADAYMSNLTSGVLEILPQAGTNEYLKLYPGLANIVRVRTNPEQIQVSYRELVNKFVPTPKEAGLSYDAMLAKRFVSAVSAKPFVVLTGLSGSGKTKLAQTFVKWISCQRVKRIPCFHPGLQISRPTTNLTIVRVDSVGMVVAQGNGTLTSFSHELIDQYVKSIELHGSNVTRNQVIADHPNIKYSPTIHMFDSALIPLAAYKLEHRNLAEVFETSLLVPVGADWTNSEKLLGYPNALDKESYVMPDSGVLKLLMDAEKNPRLPFFLILDEMNLSHVERYFADFLSAMESGDEIKLYDGDQRYGDKEKTIAIPRRIRVPKNLFVIGTMNVDETTYMFSPKVLDRAQVIEFRINDKEMADFVGHWEDANHNVCDSTVPGATWIPGKASCVDLAKLADANGVGKGAKYAESFLKLALTRDEKKPSDQTYNDPNDPNHPDNGKVPLQEVAKELNAFFKPLSELGAEFGYRSAAEILSFTGFYLDTEATITEAIDAAIVQKLLPKLHGSRRKLENDLGALWKLCLNGNCQDDLEKAHKDKATFDIKANTKYPLSAEKILRMYHSVYLNGFASFAEA